MVIIRAIDYNEVESLTIHLNIGSPHNGCAKVFNSSGVEIDTEKVSVNFNDINEIYEVAIKTKTGTRIATILNIECDNETVQ